MSTTVIRVIAATVVAGLVATPVVAQANTRASENRVTYSASEAAPGIGRSASGEGQSSRSRAPKARIGTGMTEAEATGIARGWGGAWIFAAGGLAAAVAAIIIAADSGQPLSPGSVLRG